MTKERALELLAKIESSIVSPHEIMEQSEINEVLEVMELTRKKRFSEGLVLIANGGPKFLNSETQWRSKQSA